MEDYIVWQPTEANAENLLIWWGTREPFIHEDDCSGELEMHCCQGKLNYLSGYGLECPSPPWDYSNMTFIYPDGTKVLMNAGDKVYYDGKGVYRLEKK